MYFSLVALMNLIKATRPIISIIYIISIVLMMIPIVIRVMNLITWFRNMRLSTRRFPVR